MKFLIAIALAAAPSALAMASYTPIRCDDPTAVPTVVDTRESCDNGFFEVQSAGATCNSAGEICTIPKDAWTDFAFDGTCVPGLGNTFTCVCCSLNPSEDRDWVVTSGGTGFFVGTRCRD